MKASDIWLLNEELKGNTALTELNLESEDEKRERDGERRKKKKKNDSKCDWSRRSKSNEFHDESEQHIDNTGSEL